MSNPRGHEMGHLAQGIKLLWPISKIKWESGTYYLNWQIDKWFDLNNHLGRQIEKVEQIPIAIWPAVIIYLMAYPVPLIERRTWLWNERDIGIYIKLTQAT